MNKRQRKKNVTRAIERIEAGEHSSKDIKILTTYGEEEFLKRYGFSASLYQIDIGHQIDLVLFTVSKALSRMLLSASEAIENLGKAFKTISNDAEERLAKKEEDENDGRN